MTRTLHPWQNYAVAAGLFALALGLRYVLLPVEAGLAYLTFYPGLVICALLCSWRPALLYIALAAPVGTYIFNPPYYGFAANDVAVVTTFAVSAFTILAALEIFKRRTAFIPAPTELGSVRDTKLILGLCLTLGLLVVMGFVVIRQDFREREDVAWVVHTHEVETHIKSLLSNVIDAETGERGYLITGQDLFLEPYRNADVRVESDLQRLRELTHDDPLQQQRLAQLAPLLKKRLDRLAVQIALRQQQGFAAAQAELATGVGKALQDQIRTLAAELQTAERTLGEARLAHAQSSANLTIAVSMFSLTGAISALGFSVWRLMHALRARRRAEEEVRNLNTMLATRADDLELRLRLAARASNTGFWDWDLRTNFVYFSPEYKAQLGYTEHEMLTGFVEWESRLHPDDREATQQRVHAYLAAPRGDYEAEFRLRHRDGSYRWILARGLATLGADGKPERMLGSHIDITTYKETELALRESRELLQLFIEHAPVALAMFDGEMRYVAVSRQWLNDYFLGERDIIGHSHYEIFPEITDAWKDIHRRGLAGETLRADEDRFERQDGTVQWIEWEVLPWYTGSRKVGGIIIVTEDITERVKLKNNLLQSERKFSALFYQSPIPQVMSNSAQDYQTVEVNKAMAQMFGFSREEMLGKSFPQLGISRDLVRRKQALDTLEKKSQLINHEYTLYPKVGDAIIVLAHVTQLDIDEEHFTFTAMQNITQRKQMESLLVKSEQEFRKLAESMPQIVWATRADGWNTYFNQQWVDYTGLTLEASYGQGWNKPVHPEDLQRIWDAWTYAINNRGNYSQECRLRRADGVYRWWLIRGVPVLDEHGNITKWFGTCTDIDDIKHTELKLRESEMRLMEAQRIAHIGSWEWQLGDSTIVWSDETFRIYGVPQQPAGVSMAQLIERIHVDDRPAMQTWIETCATGQSVPDLEFRAVLPNGETRVLNGRGELRSAEHIGRRVMVGTVQDITELKQYEHALRQKNIELERFTYMISHDLKSPLVTIKTFLSYLQQDLAKPDAARVEQDINFIATASENMSRMLEELLEFMRVGRVKTLPVCVTWRELVDEALTMNAGALTQRGVRVDIADSALVLCGERLRLVQLWQNLLGNAIKFIGEQPKPLVSIGVELRGQDATFYVCDNGIGIDPRYHDKIFGLFEKLDTRAPGSGLGLALVKRIVEQYGGRINVVSAGTGQGACFRFTLPGAISNERQGITT